MSKFQIRIGLFFLGTVVSVLGTCVCTAQDNTVAGNREANRDPATTSSAPAASIPNPAPSIISFQLRDWKQMHFNDVQQAEKHLKTVEQLGCVAKKSQHGDHIDVQYHCQEWKSISIDTPQAAQQWHRWLTSAGFDVFNPQVAPEFSSGTEAVQFRLAEAKAFHGDGTPQQAQFIDTLKKLGCDVRENQHDGHTDIQFRAPTWCTIRLADEAKANEWNQWLTTQGFESKLLKKENQ